MTGRRTAALLLARGLSAALVAGAALALTVLLVDWVEAGARGEGGVTAALLDAILEVPGHVARGAPLVAALAAALAAASLVRSGEWQALGAAGLRPATRLVPLAFVGLLVGGGAVLLQEAAVPAAALRRARLESAGAGGPLLVDGQAWISAEDAVFRVTPAGDATLGPSRAWRRLPGGAIDRRDVEGLAWDGVAWVPLRAPSGTPRTSRWSALPPPEVLDALLAPGDPADRAWSSLAEDPRPVARAEVQARLSRPVSCVPAALAGAGVPLALGATSWAVASGVLPVVAWEVAASAVQAAAGQGALPAPWVAVLRLLLAVAIAALVLRPLGRPGPSG